MAIYRCTGCGHLFDEAIGDKHEGYPPMAFRDVPEDFTCSHCGVRYKEDFVEVPQEQNI